MDYVFVVNDNGCSTVFRNEKDARTMWQNLCEQADKGVYYCAESGLKTVRTNKYDEEDMHMALYKVINAWGSLKEIMTISYSKHTLN